MPPCRHRGSRASDGATTRTVFNIPGNGGLTGRWDDRGRVAYYLAAHTAFKAGDRGLNQGKMHDTYWASADLSPDALRDAMDKYPGVERLVVWERFEPDTPTDALDGEDPYLAALGNGWSILAKRRYELRQFWNWRWLGWMRRTVYQRDTAASAPPSDGAAP